MVAADLMVHPTQMQVYLRRWRPSSYVVDPIQEIILDENTLEHLRKRVRGGSGGGRKQEQEWAGEGMKEGGGVREEQEKIDDRSIKWKKGGMEGGREGWWKRGMEGGMEGWREEGRDGGRKEGMEGGSGRD